MGVIPTKKVEQLQFFESHWPVWNDAPTTIGLTSGQVASFKTLVLAARADYDAAQNVRNAAKAATTAQDASLAAAYNSAADLIRVIKSYAAQQADPAVVYAAAQVPPPADPQPAPPPGQPTNITVNLESNGAITLHWKCVNAAASAGTFFSVQRKLAAESAFTLVGNTGLRQFTDSTIVQGTPSAIYIVQGHRGDVSGPASDQIGLQFGVGGLGAAGGNSGFTILSGASAADTRRVA